MNAHTYMSPEAPVTGDDARTTSKFRSQPSSDQRGLNIGHLGSNPEIRPLQVDPTTRSDNSKNDIVRHSQGQESKIFFDFRVPWVQEVIPTKFQAIRTRSDQYTAILRGVKHFDALCS